MLQNIRDRAQGFFAWLIFSLIAIPFALWGIHEYLRPTPKIVVAKVNGTELSASEFEYGVQQQRQQLRRMLPPNSDLSLIDDQFIRHNTLKRMIEEEVLVQSALKAGLRISDTVLARRINEFPAFQEDGVFSQDTYEKFLRHQGLSTGLFEMQIRRSLLTDQLREGILRSTPLTELDLNNQARLEKQRRAVTYLIIPATTFNQEVTISPDEIKNYYEKHQKTLYLNPEQVSIQYVQLSQTTLPPSEKVDEAILKQTYQEKKDSLTTPPQWHAQHLLVAVDLNAPPANITAAKQKSQDLLAKLRSGSSFEALAKQFSEDSASAQQGGDLGWFGPGAMVKPFEEAITKMKTGEISEPVQSQFGFHIIKLLATKPATTPTFEEVREQLKKDFLKEQVETVFYGQAEQFANLAFENPNTLEPLAKTLNLKIQTTELFDRNTTSGKDPLLANRKVIETAFNDNVLKEGFNSEVIEIDKQNIVVLRVKDHVEATVKPLSEVKDKITAALTQEKAQEKAKALGKSLLDQIKQSGNPQVVVKPHHLTWSSASWIERHDTTLKQPQIATEAFKMGQPTGAKALYRGIELPNGDYALIAVLGVKDGKPTAAKTEEPEKRAQMQQQRALGESEFQQLVAELKAGAQVEEYPENIKSPSSTPQY